MWLGSVGSTAIDVSLCAPVLCVILTFFPTAAGASPPGAEFDLNGAVLKRFGVLRALSKRLGAVAPPAAPHAAGGGPGGRGRRRTMGGSLTWAPPPGVVG